MKVIDVAQNSLKGRVSVCLGVGMAACAALPSHGQAATLAPQSSVWQECAPLFQHGGMQRAFQLASVHLLSQGLRLTAQGCPFVRVASGQVLQVLDVRVWVINSEVAANFVRGPLADGHEVDMGDVQLTPPAAGSGWVDTAREASPDVLFNREWLSKTMGAQGLQAVPGHWWAFVLAYPRRL